MADIVLFGTGQIAEVVHFYIENDTDHRVVAITADAEFITQTTWKGLPVVPFQTLEAHYPPDKVKLLLPLSYRNVNKARRDHYLDAKQRGYGFISYISSKATYYGTPVGENSIVMEDNTLQPFCSVGHNVILWSGNHVGHHACIEDHAFVSSHVVISGAATVGEMSFIGVNATVHDSVRIGRESVIGAGAIVSKDLPDFSVLRPARSSLSELKSFDLKGL